MMLFRSESLHSQRQAWLGSIHVMQPLGLAWLTFGVLATLVAVSTFLFWGEMPRTARLSGVVVPQAGWIRVLPPVSGRLVAIDAREGQRVAEGDALFALEVPQAQWAEETLLGLRQSVETRQRSLDQALQQARDLLQAQSRSVAQRLLAARREAAALADQAAQQRQQLGLAEAALARWEAMARDGYVSGAQVQEKQGDVLGRRADSAAIGRQREALSADIAALEAQERELPLQMAQRMGELERERAELTELLSRDSAAQSSRQLRVRAPVAGTVAALHASLGQVVTPEVALGTLTPMDSELSVQLYAPSSAMGFVQAGQHVRLRVQAFPYQKYGWLAGQVQAVAQAPLLASELVGLPLRGPGSEPLYRVTVTLAADHLGPPEAPRPLQVGMQVDADVVLERRRLMEWLFEPLLGWVRR